MTPYIIGEGKLATVIKNYFDESTIPYKWFRPSVEHKYFTKEYIIHKKYMYVVAIPDSKLDSFFDEFKSTTNELIIIFSGNVDIFNYHHLEHLKKLIKIHPMMTFNDTSDPKLFKTSPVLFQGPNDLLETINSILKLEHVYNFDIKNSSAYHLMGVFASNFQIALMKIVRDLAKYNGIDQTHLTKFILPIIKETINNIEKNNHLDEVLTGPAKRKDQVTIDKHIRFLDEFNDDYKIIYEKMTKVLQDLDPK